MSTSGTALPLTREARALAEAILEAAFLGVPAFPDDPDADFPEPRPGERWSVFQRRGEGYFATARMREMWRRYFQDLRVAEADAEHLFPFSDAAWRRLAAMAGENRIQAAQGDFAEADGAMAGLARALREAGVPVTVFYASNAAQHFGDAPGSLDRFLGNLEAFGWAEDPAAVVLLTGTPGPSAPFDKALMPRLEAGLDVWTYHALAPGQVRNAM